MHGIARVIVIMYQVTRGIARYMSIRVYQWLCLVLLGIVVPYRAYRGVTGVVVCGIRYRGTFDTARYNSRGYQVSRGTFGTAQYFAVLYLLY